MYNNPYENDSRIPFINGMDKWRPKFWKDAISLSIFFITRVPEVSAVLAKAAEYPLTSFRVSCSDTEIEKKCKKMLKDLKVLSRIKGISRSLKFSGNVPIVIYYPFKRKLCCPKCKVSHHLTKDNFKYSEGVFRSKCKCGYEGEHQVDDSYDRSQFPKMVELDIRDFDIVKNDFNEEYKFYYDLPKKDHKKLKGNSTDFDYLRKVPKEYIDCIKNKKKILYDESKLHFLKNHSIKGHQLFDFIGVPDVYMPLEDLLFNSTLKKSDITTISDKLQGMNYISPAQPTQNGGAGPASVAMDLFREYVERAELKRKIDPNSTQVFPYPIYYGRAGGDGRSSLTIQERQVVVESIVNGLGYPIEFLRGGMQWSGSSVTLRMLQNQFLNFREDIESLMDFYIKKVSLFKNWATIPTVSFTDFKMADDVQQRNIDVNLAMNNKMSWTSVLAEQGVDYIEEMEKKLKESEMELKIMKIEAMKAAISVKESTKAQAEAQMEATRNTVESTLRNFDGSDDTKDISFTADQIIKWVQDNYPIGKLTGATESNIFDARIQFEEQMRQQSVAASQQPQTQEGGNAQEDGQGENNTPQDAESKEDGNNSEQPGGSEQGYSPDNSEAPNEGVGNEEQEDILNSVIRVVSEAKKNNIPDDDVIAYLRKNNVSDDIIEQAMSGNEENIESESNFPEEDSPLQYNEDEFVRFLLRKDAPTQYIMEQTGYAQEQIDAIRKTTALNNEIIPMFSMLMSFDNTTRDKYIEQYKSSHDTENFNFEDKYNAFEIIIKSIQKNIDIGSITNNLSSLGYFKTEDMVDFVKKAMYYATAAEGNKKLKAPTVIRQQQQNGQNLDNRPLPERLPPRRN